MTRISIILLGVIGLLFACTEKKRRRIGADEFLSHNYKVWDQSNILVKSFADTTFLIGLDSNNTAIQRSISFESTSDDSTLSAFFRKRGFITLKDCSKDSVNQEFLYNPKLGNLYKIIRWKGRVELSQQNPDISLDDSF